MTEVIFTLIGLVLGAALFALGFFASRERESLQAPREQESDDSARLRQLEADRRAFRALMGYNADVAYGSARFDREDEA